MSVTIKDVAKLANVAPSTVSRVISNSPRISEKTKRKVRKVMDELNYHPNLNARSLANSSTKSIGVVLSPTVNTSFQNPFFAEVIRGITSYINQKDYSLYFITGKNEEEIAQLVNKTVKGGRVDGIILLYSKENDPIIQYLNSHNYPFVLVGKPYSHLEEITYIDNDNYSASREVTNYLLSLGHKNIAFVGGEKNLLVTKERLRGYEDALKLNGLRIIDEFSIFTSFTREGGMNAVEQLLSINHEPTAIVVTDDILALGVISALKNKGFSVPEDISVVSFNNALIAELASPPLTSVDINIYQLGYEAAKNIIYKVEEPDGSEKSIIVPYKLIIRDTCSINNVRKLIES
ncbi:LacI family DNA-binding transcriptional regulator [Bacillus sp. RG28]|uniref:LacI family DNA-binding transcriptional regulator n=1 Tax=Gottfriedia endophytica TaxID=2820819 RepID=A0A940NPL6_9BACI|nr:LacI family DNA-binding transcriptional regulator [Gottfriedia endophytica]MBP0724571.1 LacI family DNA-binding transcriptional regulator [Gottfriedia endophytica]